MGDVINLRLARKARVRAVKEREAGANRARFGRTKAARAAEAEEEVRRSALLDGAKLDD
ncbi:DUF4169 family protein [Sphingomonas sp.]|jgi:hypothetical protein|uniref:DUF4169 family protein n=1 Tax=Sphingomonas sp. TaxID=28214 RepID=UPI002ED8CFDE